MELASRVRNRKTDWFGCSILATLIPNHNKYGAKSSVGNDKTNHLSYPTLTISVLQKCTIGMESIHPIRTAKLIK